MIHDVTGQHRWLLTTTGGPVRVAPEFHPLAAEWSDVADRERRLGIAPGQPVLVSSEVVDYRLGDYFRDGFAGDQRSTALTYATELRTWLNFLDTRRAAWHEATRADVRAYQLWRVYDEQNPQRVSAATWNKGWAALRHFYGWAVRRGWVDVSPVEEQHRLRNPMEPGGFREKNARQSRDRWITPSEYAMWRDVGLRGYRAQRNAAGRIVAGLPDEAARSRNQARNVAFADYLITTGLRLEEAGTLLDVEVPANVGEEVPIVGKGGARRHYRAMHRLGLESIHQYVVGERRDAVRRAGRAAGYERLDRLDVAEVLHGRGGQAVRLTDGRVLSVAVLSRDERERLFAAAGSGPEPVMLWLTESGMPMTPQNWDKVFDAANDRVTRARAELGVVSPWVKVTPHSLRFTFALFTLLASVRAIDEYLGLNVGDPFVLSQYTQAFDEVRDLLGHASVATTKQIYLEPVKGLRRSQMLRNSTIDQMWDGLVTHTSLIGFN